MTEHSIKDSLPGGIPAIKLRKKLTKLQFREATNKTIIIESLSIIQRTQPNPLDTKLSDIKPLDHYQLQLDLSTKLWVNQHQQPYPKVAESENIRANHLGFMKSLFQHYCEHLRLNHNHISAESVFNFYVNERIAYLLGIPVNTESSKETFYSKLIQNTSLLTNHNFTSIITKINKEIELHTQQRYPITYASKSKRKLQTPAVTPKKIQPPTWKKTRVESPIAPSYYYTLRSAINITSASTSTSNTILKFGQFPFQSKQRKTNLLRPYKNPEIKTLNIQTLQNQNPEVIHQHLPPVIVINRPQVEPIGQPIQTPNQQNQQSLPVPPQQQQQLLLQQQQLLLQQQQQMAYAPIMKLNKFTGEEDNTQVWLNNVEKAIAANGWNDARAMQAIPYFLKNTPTLSLQLNKEKLKQLPHIWDTSIEIYDKSKQLMLIISQCHRFSINSSVASTLKDAVIHIRDFESAELKANHVHAINLVINGSSELDSKLKQFSDSINQKLEGYLADNHTIYQPPQRCNNPGNANHFQNQSHPSLLSAAPNQPWQPEMRISNSELLPKSRSNYLPANDTVTNLSTTSISNSSLSNTHNLSTTATSNLSATTSSSLSTPTTNSNTTTKLASKWNPKAENDTTKLAIGDDSPPTNLQFVKLANRISSTKFRYQSYPKPKFPELFKSPATRKPTQSKNLPAMITEDKTLAAIFPFKFEETTPVLLFSRAALEKKPITAMYTDAKVDGHSIKLILDSDQLGHQVDHAASAHIITADGATKTPISKIDNLPIEINGLTVPIKVLVMETTQY
ncbi:hypothetical protein G9A89_003664 [Geosiphon pyriformis]|nr:hypothetical protein G9A89_003664 [Geosiphon pyriformis]